MNIREHLAGTITALPARGRAYGHVSRRRFLLASSKPRHLEALPCLGLGTPVLTDRTSPRRGKRGVG